MGAVTFNFGAGYLYTSSGVGNLVPVGGLVIIAASTDNLSFGAPNDMTFLSESDDREIARGSVNPAGEFALDKVVTYADYPGLSIGDPLRIYWYPELTTSDLKPTLGTSYGVFYSDVKQYGSDIAWFVPTDSGDTVALSLITKNYDSNADNFDSAGVANLTVVPEPGEYMALIGLASMGFVGLRRYFSRKG